MNKEQKRNGLVFNILAKFASIIAVSFATLSVSYAQGDLLISPLRIIFDGNTKTQEINLANVGKDTASYAVSIVNIRMKENGGFEEITEPDSGQRFAGPFLRFFPRKVTLAPNEAQVVKVQVVKSNELQEGEYRSHLYFRAVNDDKPLGIESAKKDSGISIHITPIFGITIPVIIRSGNCSAGLSFSDVSFSVANDTPVLNVDFNRTGNISVYGDFMVNYISPVGISKQVCLMKGVGIYTPNLKRHMSALLNTDKGADYHNGKLRITYAMQQSDKSVKNIESEIELK